MMRAPQRTAELVLALHEVSNQDTAGVGGKTATLGLLVRAGLAVPEGLVLTTAALGQVLTQLGPEPTADEVTAAALPGQVERALASVAGHFGDAVLAVRSSGVEEDLPEASFAGQYETVLGVHGLDALRAAVRRCWASGYGERARSYRRTLGRPAASPLAVLVQRQVDADVAGVAFTANPVTGATDEVLVSATPGLGDALVSGQTTPDEWIVRGDAATAVRVTHQALTEMQARVVAALALRVQSILGCPQDVEWAMADGRLVVLQARPITALPQAPVVELPPGTWLKESERHPRPLTALGASLAGPVVAGGLTDMFAAYGGLLERFETASIGGEPYVRVVPIGGRGGPPPPWWTLAVAARVAPPLRARMRTARRMLRPEALAAQAERWWTQWRPAYRAAAERLRAVELSALSDQALAAHTDECVAIARDALHVHFQLIPPYLVPVHDLIRTCERLLGWSEVEALTLLAGTSETTFEPAQALARLAARIRRSAPALAAVETSGANPADLAEHLTDADAELGASFAGWCASYAHRNVNDDPGSPTLAERPALLAGLLRDAVQAAAQGPADTATAREDATRRARAGLAGRSQRDRDRFERELAAALRAYPLREDVAFWTGSVFGALLRMVALEVGRRLVARGLLDRVDDTVHLDFDTLRAAIDAAPPDDLRARVARARAERAWVSTHPGPARYGPPPAPFPDLRGIPRDGRRLNEALLWMQRRSPAPPPGAGVAVTGVAGSPGRYTGPVRVVHGEADFGQLRPGDVLVCPTTDPAWSVLFGTAGALVTDGGGVLSHAAIIAREHAIPAVIGTGTATHDLRDGDVVTVDGSSGRVELHHDAPDDEGEHR